MTILIHFFVGKMNIGGVKWTVAFIGNITVTLWPLSAVVSSPTCFFFPFTDNTLSFLWTVETPVSSALYIWETWNPNCSWSFKGNLGVLRESLKPINSRFIESCSSHLACRLRSSQRQIWISLLESQKEIFPSHPLFLIKLMIDTNFFC